MVKKKEGIQCKDDNNLNFVIEYTPKNGFHIRNIYIKLSYLLYDDFIKTKQNNIILIIYIFRKIFIK